MKLSDWALAVAALFFLVMINACSVDGKGGKNGDPGIPGVPGHNGHDGNNGNDGSDGLNSLASLIDILPGITCPNGGTLFSVGLDVNRDDALEPTEIQQASYICNGLNGNNGNDGHDGSDGHDGTNGHDGHDAVTSPFMPVEIIDPCGDTPGKFDEVLVRLANGILLATISDSASGQNTRLGEIPYGTSWVTTDGTNCHITVLSNGTVTW